MIDGPFWIVGCGNMGGAMLRGWIGRGLDPAQVTAIDPGAPALPEGVRGLRALPADGEVPATVLLAVKPQLLDAVAPALAAAVGEGTVLVSILAGVELASLRARFPQARAIVRAMPNMAVGIGKGVTALIADTPDPAVAASATALMEAVGSVEWIREERLFDAVTAVSGCGPAFLFRFVDALAAGGAALGLPADQALRLALATAEGAAMLAMGSEESPAVLADRVASPGGSTREGLNVLDAGDALAELMAETVAAAARRNAELAAAAR